MQIPVFNNTRERRLLKRSQFCDSGYLSFGLQGRKYTGMQLSAKIKFSDISGISNEKRSRAELSVIVIL